MSGGGGGSAPVSILGAAGGVTVAVAGFGGTKGSSGFCGGSSVFSSTAVVDAAVVVVVDSSPSVVHLEVDLSLADSFSFSDDASSSIRISPMASPALRLSDSSFEQFSIVTSSKLRENCSATIGAFSLSSSSSSLISTSPSSTASSSCSSPSSSRIVEVTGRRNRRRLARASSCPLSGEGSLEIHDGQSQIKRSASSSRPPAQLSMASVEGVEGELSEKRSKLSKLSPSSSSSESLRGGGRGCCADGASGQVGAFSDLFAADNMLPECELAAGLLCRFPTSPFPASSSLLLLLLLLSLSDRILWLVLPVVVVVLPAAVGGALCLRRLLTLGLAALPLDDHAGNLGRDWVDEPMSSSDERPEEDNPRPVRKDEEHGEATLNWCRLSNPPVVFFDTVVDVELLPDLPRTCFLFLLTGEIEEEDEEEEVEELMLSSDSTSFKEKDRLTGGAGPLGHFLPPKGRGDEVAGVRLLR